MAENQWLVDFNQAAGRLDQLKEAATERDALVAKGSGAAKQTAELRKDLGQLSTTLHSLSNEVSRLQRESLITEREATRRSDMLTNLSTQVSQLQAGLSGTAPADDRDNLLNSTNATIAWGKAAETDETRFMDNQALLTQQQVMMNQQDEELGSMLKTVQRQKQIGLAIQEEVDVHNRILDDIDEDVDNVQGRLNRGVRSIAKLGKTSKQRGQLCCAFLLLTLVITGAATHWFHDLV